MVDVLAFALCLVILCAAWTPKAVGNWAAQVVNAFRSGLENRDDRP